MTERQSSGLVKKGKFVRRLMEIMGDGTQYPFSALWKAGNGEIGPTEDYVKVNLEKLVASKEVIFHNGEYRLPDGSEWLNKGGSKVEAVTSNVSGEEEMIAQVTKGQDTYNPTATKVVIVEGDKLPRAYDLEAFLCAGFVNETPGWEKAVGYYCATHCAQWEIVKFAGKIGGDRIVFSDS